MTHLLSSPSAHLSSWMVMFVLCIDGCGPSHAARDAARPDSATDGAGAAQVSIELSVDPGTLEDDTSLVQLTIGVVEVHAPNDRDELRVEVHRTFDLTSGPAVLALGPTPAVYAGAEIDIGPGDWGPSLVLRLREPTRVIELTLDEASTLVGRCDPPATLEPGDSLVLHAALDLGEVSRILRGAALPEPVGGVVPVSSASAPAVVADVTSRLRRLQLDCEGDDD